MTLTQINNPVGEDIFGDLKGLYAEEEDLDPDDESEEQELNEMVFQDFYQVLNTPFKSHYGAD